MTAFVSARELRSAFVTRAELALLDLRSEALFATGHPLFAAQLPPERIELEAPVRLPRREAAIVLYDNGEGLVGPARERFVELGYTHVLALRGGLAAWKDAGYELFRDVNSYSKAFGELVEARRHTPSVPPEDLRARLDHGADLAILDARPFEEFQTMSIPGAVSVPGAELVLRARAVAPSPATMIVVTCAGRTRSLIGAQSLINAGLPNPVAALRNGTIGWTLAGLALATGARQQAPEIAGDDAAEARRRAREVSYRAGVRHIDEEDLERLAADRGRTLYRFDVRDANEHAAGHPPGFRHAPGGQLVQEIDAFAPVRGARLVLADPRGARADMTASWLAQMGWEVYVFDQASDHSGGETGFTPSPPPRGPDGRYQRPYEGTDNPKAALRAYIDWELGLVAQLARDGSHGFFVT